MVPLDTVLVKYGTPFKIIGLEKDKEWNYEDTYRVQMNNGEFLYVNVGTFEASLVGGSILSYDPQKRETERIAEIRRRKWAAEIERAVISKKILLGMTYEQIQMSWGKPQRVNRSVGAWGVREQWIYGSTYLYVENGKLASWQETR
jgi:hypothetical protein